MERKHIDFYVRSTELWGFVRCEVIKTWNKNSGTMFKRRLGEVVEVNEMQCRFISGKVENAFDRVQRAGR